MSRLPDDRRPPMVVAMAWVSQITTIGLEMVLPAALGFWLDGRWGTTPGLTITGAVLGFIVSMQQLLQIARDQGRKTRPRGPDGKS